MGTEKKRALSEEAATLRLLAEEQLGKKGAEDQPPATEAELQRLLHELQVHQVELEMQNEELRRAREEQETILERYTDLYDFAPVGYFTLDCKGLIRAANLTGAGLVGVERSSLIGRTFCHFVDLKDFPHFSELLKNLCASRDKKSYEVTILNAKGRLLHAQIEAVGISSEECRIAVIDATERREAEANLRRSEQRLAEAQGITHVGNWEWNSISDEIAVSEEFNRIFGQVLTTYDSFVKLVHADDRAFVKEAVSETLLHRTPYDVRYRIVRPDGVTRVIHAMGKALTDGKGDTIGMMGTAQDVTEIREMAEKLELLNAELAAHAAELEAANIDLEAFNHMVAHDLRSPLNTISGYCQVLQNICSEELCKECKGYIQETFDAAMRMSRLIDTLLRFSRVNRSELVREKVDLSKMALEVANELEMSEPERRVAFRIAKGINVEGDANLLHIVLNNLVGNAWKYSSEKEEVVIEFGVTKKNGTPSYFVRDNGPGFDMAYAEKLFVPFRRLPGADKFKGYGIGLATVERIIRRHGGRIWAESEPGKGAAFYFTLNDN